MKDMRIMPKEYLPDSKSTTQRDNDLKKACQDFESVFTYQLLRSMRNTIEKSGLMSGGKGEEIYESMLDQEISKAASTGGQNSLAHMLYEQLKGVDLLGTGVNDELSIKKEQYGNPPMWPVKPNISSEYGWRKDPFNGNSQFHYGVDFAAKEGTPVRASLPGKVIASEFRKGYGNTVVLDHGHGFQTLYAHNNHNLVKSGDWVKGGQALAEVGSSGRSTGSHLHFEVRRNNQHLDPIGFLGNDSDVSLKQLK